MILDRAVLSPDGLTTSATDLYLSGDFILMCFGNTVKTKENHSYRFPGKSDLVGKDSLTTNCLIRWYSCKIGSLRLHKQKKRKENAGFLPKPNIPFESMSRKLKEFGNCFAMSSWFRFVMQLETRLETCLQWLLRSLLLEETERLITMPVKLAIW